MDVVLRAWRLNFGPFITNRVAIMNAGESGRDSLLPMVSARTIFHIHWHTVSVVMRAILVPPQPHADSLASSSMIGGVCNQAINHKQFALCSIRLWALPENWLWVKRLVSRGVCQCFDRKQYVSVCACVLINVYSVLILPSQRHRHRLLQKYK